MSDIQYHAPKTIKEAVKLLTAHPRLFFGVFQPFYKGFVTGQFNSVSIERYPLSPNAQSASNGSTVTPLVGFIGGTGGNGMTYYSGSESTVSQETNYLSGEIYKPH